MRTLNLLAFVALISGGCVVVHDNGGGGGGGGGGAGGGTTGPLTYRILPGASTVVSPGTQEGYGITANTGSNFRAVWTGDVQISGAWSHFTGTIFTPGSFTYFDPGCGGICPLEANDTIYTPAPVAGGGEQIVFDTYATDGLDGLDFAVSLEPVEFDLQVDGLRRPDAVFFPATDSGGQISSPASMPFDLTTQ